MTGSTTGNSEILSYTLWWDNGVGSDPITELVNDMVFTFLITGLEPGPYNFKVRAHNIYGAGEWSTTATIRASFVPDVVATMTVVINSDNASFDFKWIEPLTGSETVDAYEIRIYSYLTGLYEEDVTADGCDGSLSEVVDALICQIQINHLITAFGYPYNTLP